jgi:hypothetical protein
MAHESINRTSASTPYAFRSPRRGKSVRADPRPGKAGKDTPGSINASRKVILAASALNKPQLLKSSGIAQKKSWRISRSRSWLAFRGSAPTSNENTIFGKSDSNLSITYKCTFLIKEPDLCQPNYTRNKRNRHQRQEILCRQRRNLHIRCTCQFRRVLP